MRLHICQLFYFLTIIKAHILRLFQLILLIITCFQFLAATSSLPRTSPRTSRDPPWALFAASAAAKTMGLPFVPENNMAQPRSIGRTLRKRCWIGSVPRPSLPETLRNSLINIAKTRRSWLDFGRSRATLTENQACSAGGVANSLWTFDLLIFYCFHHFSNSFKPPRLNGPRKILPSEYREKRPF